VVLVGEVSSADKASLRKRENLCDGSGFMKT
jgi:hypothetical protein